MAKAIMIQGTGSDVGKSLIVAALCRIAKRRGLSVAPFKPQNMSNNAAACPDGGEIGRAQALQARAAGLDAHVDMNPVLLKPQSDKTSQIVVQGKAMGTLAARDFMGAGRTALMGKITESFNRLAAAHDLIIVEGAGSPAETNLRAGDIANMGFARQLGVPVVLLGDIEKGGVIASLVGTKAVLSHEDAAMISGFIINKFRGDPSLFDAGLEDIAARTGWQALGVIPWLSAASMLPAEDAVSLQQPASSTADHKLKIAAPMLSRMANFDDADPLRLSGGVAFQWVSPGQPLPQDADVIVLFGTKSTLADLAFLRTQGWDHDIIAHARQGKAVLGICGGYQMLGQMIHDPEGHDGEPGSVQGLGLLDVTTTMQAAKRVSPVVASCVRSGHRVTAYEIHNGQTSGPDSARPMFTSDDGSDGTEGALNSSGTVMGSYYHGMFADDAFRQFWLGSIGGQVADDLAYDATVDQALDQLADAVESAVDIDALLVMAQPPSARPA